jgi:hypothetical protein
MTSGKLDAFGITTPSFVYQAAKKIGEYYTDAEHTQLPIAFISVGFASDQTRGVELLHGGGTAALPAAGLVDADALASPASSGSWGAIRLADSSRST